MGCGILGGIQFDAKDYCCLGWFLGSSCETGFKIPIYFFMTAADLARSQDVLQAGRQDVTHVISDSTLQGFALDRKLQSMASEDGWHGYREACRLPPSLITSNDGGSGGTKARGNGETSLKIKDTTDYGLYGIIVS